MSNNDIKLKNNYGKVIDIDVDAIKEIFSRVDISISTSSSLFSDEYLTQSYISNLYKELGNVRNIFNSMKNISLRYGVNVETIPPANPPIKGIVDASSLNLRSGPSTEYKSIDQLKRGEEFTILNNNIENDDWFQVETLRGDMGYVNKDYTKIIKDENL